MTPDLRPITEIAPLIRSGALSPVALVDACLTQIQARPSVNAFITVLADSARTDARRAEAEIAAGNWRGPLHGVPIAVKDLIDVAGTRTTSGSAVPTSEAVHDAPVVRRLREAGAVVIGKTNLHEFAYGTTSEESAFGPVRNPLDESRSAGGSSGGSAAALAAGMCFGAVGTDTGGSVRIPSAACGTFGLKPSIEELPCDGVVALSMTLDHVGPMTRSVADLGLMFHAMRGVDIREVAPAQGRFVFGVPRPYFFDLLEPGVRSAFEHARESLVSAGHEVIDVEIDQATWTATVYLHIALPEATWYHALWLERHASSYSPSVRLRLEMGRYVLAEDYVRAMRLRDVLKQRVDRALQHCDALMLPTLPIPPPTLGSSTVKIGDAQEPVRAAMLRLTQLFNITGHPALTLPTPRSNDGLPRAVQLVGARSQTERLLALSGAVEPYISGGPGSVGGGTG
jgi:aspartyl-tRNA(Asn)/glutamyl-tRNA(Gln) amidotransferase subunit A